MTVDPIILYHLIVDIGEELRGTSLRGSRLAHGAFPINVVVLHTLVAVGVAVI